MRSMVEGPFERANNYENRSWSMGSAPPHRAPLPRKERGRMTHSGVMPASRPSTYQGNIETRGVDRRNQSGKSRYDGAKNFHT